MDDLGEGPAGRVGDRSQRPAGGVPEGQQVDEEAVGGEPQQPAGQILVLDRAVARPDPEVGGKPIALRTAYCLRLSVVNIYSMTPVTPKPTSIATASMAPISPTSSEFVKYHCTVSDLKSSVVRAFRPVTCSILLAKVLGDRPEAAFTSTNVSLRLSGNRKRLAFERVA